MNLKRYMQLAILLALPMMILIIGNLEAQYIGSGRPLSRQETLDSLAAKPDTSVTNQLQAEQDSTQDTLDVMYGDIDNLEDAADSLNSNVGAKLDTSAVAAGDNVTVDWDGSSLTIASSGGGGGSNWNPADSTLSLDLPYYFGRNVVHQWGVDVYGTIVNHSLGEHGDSTTNFLTDEQSIGVYVPASGANDGILYPVPHGDWTHWADGDTMELGSTYFCMAVRLDSVSHARLPDAGIRVLAGRSNNNFKATNITKASLSEGWNFVKEALSSWTINAGSPSWAQCDTVWIMDNGTASADGGLIFIVDNVQLVRGIDGKPNPYQSEGPNGTWTADRTEEGNGNFWIVEESGIIAAMSGDGAVSTIQIAETYVKYKLSGITRTASTTAAGFIKGASDSQIGLGNQILRVLDSLGTWHSKTFAYASGDKIYWKAIRDGTSLTGMASLTGLDGDWTGVSTFCNAAAGYVKLYPRTTGDRYYSLGLSAVEYATEAGAAQRLKDWHFDYDGGLFKIIMPDSVLWFTPDSVTVNPN